MPGDSGLCTAIGALRAPDPRRSADLPRSRAGYRARSGPGPRGSTSCPSFSPTRSCRRRCSTNSTCIICMHQIGLRIERAAVEAAGISWRAYEGFVKKHEKPIEEEKLHRVPRDLDLTPYRDLQDFPVL